MKDVQEVPINVFALTVGLTRFNNFRGGGGNSLYASFLDGTLEFFGGFTDRLLSHPTGSFFVLDDESPDQVVETRTELMNDFASDDRQAQGWLRANKIYRALGRISVELADKTISFAIKQGGDLAIELADVFIGLLNFGFDSKKGIVTCYHSIMTPKRSPQKTPVGHKIQSIWKPICSQGILTEKIID